VLGLAVALDACTLTVDLDHLSDGIAPAATDAGMDAPDGAPPSDASAVTDARADAGPDVGGTADASDPLSLGLVGYWKLDEATGTSAADSSGKGNAGTLLGGPTWEPKDGGSPGALFFDGVDDHVDIAGAVPYATENAAFSFSAWFNVIDFVVIGPDIMQVRSDGTSPWHVLLSNDAQYAGVSLGSADRFAPIKTGTPPSLGVWHHVAVVYDGKAPGAISSFQIFLDGVSQNLFAAGGYASQQQQSRIGAAEDPNNQFHGLIREVRLYDRALSTEEIAKLYAAR
jgi:hypothetical protein